MLRKAWSVVALSCIVGSSANAQDEGTFVSDGGNDSNNCISIAEACRSIDVSGGALSKTLERGVIQVLPGKYGSFTVDKAIEILADEGQASIPGPLSDTVPTMGGSAKIVINAGGGDKVRVRGFIIDNAFVIEGSHGVAFVTGGSVQLEDCTLVNGGSASGIIFAPAGGSELYISNCTMSGNGNGIVISPRGSGSAKVVIDRVDIRDNAGGILIDGSNTTGAVTVTVRNSVSSGNGSFGIAAQDNSGGGAINVMIEDTTFSNNAGTGVRATGGNVTIRMRNSTVSGNNSGLAAQTGGEIISNGGNVIRGNTPNGSFSGTEAQQ